MGDPTKPSRWALSVPVGVVVSVGTGLVLSMVAGPSQRIPEWQTNIGSAVILLLGTIATGTVAGARTAREWVQALVLTLVVLVAIAVVIFVYAVSLETPR
jgi:hypothetical protein